MILKPGGMVGTLNTFHVISFYYEQELSFRAWELCF